MKTVFKFLVAAVVLGQVARCDALRAESYAIDAAHTSVIFGISHLGYSYTYGRFNKVSGGYQLDRANPAASQFQLVIDAASIDTNDPKRDEHLRGPDFFNAKQFPVISFQSARIVPKQSDRGTIYEVTGNLTIHGVTRQVTLPIQKQGEGKGPYGNYRTGFLCQTSLKRSEFGMTNMIPMAGDEVAVTISFEGVRQGGAAASGSAGGATRAPAAPAKGSGPAGGSGAKEGSGSSGKR